MTLKTLVSHLAPRLALGAALALGGAALLPLQGPLGAQMAQAQALSPAVGRPLQQASAAARAGNTAAAMQFVNQARQAARAPHERTRVAQMAAFVHTRAGQYAQAAAELERIGAPPSQLAPLYYQARQYDRAIAAAQRSGQMTIVAQSYLMQGKANEAAKIYQQMLERQPNNAQLLQNLAAAQYRMGDREAYTQTIQRLIRVDPTPQRWRSLLVTMRQERMSRDAQLALLHLMRETGSLTTANDVQEFARLAIVGGQPGVAVDVVRRAAADNVMDPSDAMTNRLIEAATQRQQQAIAQAPANARQPGTAIQAGHAFLGAGQFGPAIQAYNVAAQGPNSSEAAVFRGIAQVRAGQIGPARQSFEAVQQGSMRDVAGLWALYASTRT